MGALSKGKAKVKTFRREVIGKPNDRKGHVRFDEGMVETQFGCAPLFYSTKWDYTDADPPTAEKCTCLPLSVGRLGQAGITQISARRDNLCNRFKNLCNQHQGIKYS